MILALLLLAATPQQRFESGDAAAALQMLEQNPSPKNAVWRYNHALSAHAAGQLGKAISDYEWLSLDDPQDDAVRINRLLARLDRGVGDDAEPPLGQLTRLPLRSLIVIGLLAVFIALVRRQRADSLFRACRNLASLCLLLFALHHLLLALDSRAVAGRQSALRERPDAQARKVLEIPEGNLLSVMGTQGDWIEVRSGSGVIGWLERSALISLQRGFE
jgi:hypothetical protein